MPIVLLALILVTVLVSFAAFSNDNLKSKFLFDIQRIRSGEQFRMLTSGFIHGDIFHLVFNMYALFLFGSQFISASSALFFVVIYFVGLFAGNLLTLVLYQNNLSYRALGASGAVSAIVFGSVIFDPQQEIKIFPIPFDIPAYIFGLIFLLYSLYGIKAANDNIGHTAHLGGAAAGYLFTAISYKTTFLAALPYTLVPAAAFLVLGIYHFGFKK
ncbi:rhomboid family intramembrane serine protease [Flavobacterium sp.]|uniref:rhomboid family intramembrane serine protease n=1 Tax=Flavobacterium sp. TaxID=239 RepID=UPI0026355974|nr:rhomboid family intramembrane serine protease [Flavobacterium sp.]